MGQITDIVKKLLIANVAIYFIYQMIGSMRFDLNPLYFYGPKTGLFSPYQIITHMFMHGNTQHLIFNMLGLYFFGPRVEQVWGEKKFLGYYLICGLGSLGLYYLVQEYIFHDYVYSLVGASGAIYGIFVAFAFMYPKERVMLIFPPIEMSAAVMVGLFMMSDLILGISGAQTGIGHFAHLGGALIGIAMLFYWKSNKQLYS